MLQVSDYIHLLHTFANMFFLFCVQVKSKFTERQNENLKKNLYWNHGDTFLDISNPLSDKLMGCQQTEPFIACKEALGYHVMIVVGIMKITYYIFYKINNMTTIHLFWISFSTTHIRKVDGSQICSFQIIYYSYVPSIKFEGRFTKKKHVPIKVRK